MVVNIAEGFGSQTKNQFDRFLNISRGSFFQLKTQLGKFINLSFKSGELFNKLYDDSKEIERMISIFQSK